MKKRSFYSFMLAGVITLAASVVTGCTEHEDSPVEISPQLIVINYTDTVVDIQPSPVSGTRSQSASSVLTNKSGKKMYLSCTESQWPTDNSARTRGTKVTTASISSLGVCASVYPAASTYTSAGCGSYFYKESVSSGTPTSYYWPTAGYKISFFAYYPYNNAAFTVQSAANVTGAPTYAYTVPSVISNQLDIMTGQVTDQLGGSSSAVNMSLVHRCSAVHFNVTNDRSDAITVNSISIEGVKYTGTLNESTWTLGSGVNSSSTNPFTLACNTSVAAGATTDITGSSNIFLMLPQTLPSGAKLKVVVDDEEFETDLSGTWVAGKEYTYTVSMSESCIDLSKVDNSGNKRSTMTTANCYLVHGEGVYKLPLVYGNAIKNGEVNTDAFYKTYTANHLLRFVNHNGDGITGPWITKNGSDIDAGMNLTVASAELLWQDAPSLISAVGVDGDYLTFTVGTFTGGNALIAIKDGSGTILWSWHIWATEDDLSSTTIVTNNYFEYIVAPVNLGWVPTGGDGKQGYNTYYQWGRKDPFIPAAAYNSSTDHTVYDINNNPIIGITSENRTGITIADNVKNPTCFYHDTSIQGPIGNIYYNMWDMNAYSSQNKTNPTKKTIYDPCPPGFCVPTNGLYYYMSNNTSYSMWDSTNLGRAWTKDGANLWFPCVGHRNGAIANVGTSSLVWSSTPQDNTIGQNTFYEVRYLVINSSRFTYGWDYRYWGMGVRPVVEQ